MKKQFKIKVAAFSCALAFSGMAQAGFLDTLLTPNAENGFEDQSREAAIDVNGDRVFGPGDVVMGFVRIDNKFTPDSANINNQVYAIFSQQFVQTVVGGLGPVQIFQPTTAAGLTLSDLLGFAAPAGSIVAVYSTADSTAIGDLITTSQGAGATLKTYIDKITGNADLELIAGFGSGDDFLNSDPGIANVTFDSSGNPILNQSTSQQLVTNSGGLSILLNNTSFSFAELVSANNLLGGPSTLHQLSISGASTSGAHGAGPAANQAEWTNAADYIGGNNYLQCGDNVTPATDTPCGFTDKANFNVHPQAVPEPGSLALLGLGLLGLAGLKRRIR